MKIGILSAAPSQEQLPNNIRLVEEANNLGVEAEIINYRRTVSAVRDYGRELLSINDEGKLIPIEVDVVIPRVNRHIEPAIRAIDTLVSNEIPTTVSSSAIRIAKDKYSALLQLDKSGVPVPFSVSPTGFTPENTKEMVAYIEPDKSKPTIIKALRGSKGRGVVPARNRSDASSQAQCLAANEVNYLVQEYVNPVDDEPASDVRIIIIGGQIIASMLRTASSEDEFRSNIDRGGIGVPYEPTPRESELALKAAEVIGAGVVGYDGMHSYRGMLTMEVNVNPGLTIEEVTGVNVARAIVEYAISLA